MIKSLLTTSIVVAQILLPDMVQAKPSPLDVAVSTKNETIQRVLRQAKKHQVQILLTVFENQHMGSAFRYEYRVDKKHYFYPASTVKFPMALLAAEFVSKHPKISLETPYSLANSSQTFTIKNDIQLIFAISDDQAYNRLYEIIGRDYANQRLTQWGYPESKIAHRLAVPNAERAERQKVTFYSGQTAINFEGTDKPITPLNLRGLRKGNGYIKDGRLITKPFDFSRKNYFPLTEQHQLMADLVSENGSKLNLDDPERAFLLSALSLTPASAGFTEQEYFDGFAKFFLFGDTRKPMPEYLKIYNKVGYAYGTLTDNAYISDENNKISFLLTATLLVNQNGIFNDDTYEYDSVGLPFLAQLGREVYKLLLNQSE